MKVGDLVYCIISGKALWMYVLSKPSDNYVTLSSKRKGLTGPSDVYRLSDIRIIGICHCLL